MAVYSVPRTWATGELVTASMMNQYVRDQQLSAEATGMLRYKIANPTAVETLHDGGWLECNGVQVSRTTYSALFTYLNGLTPALPFGSGDGSTTFHLPDMAGRMLVSAASGGHADVATLGNNDGAAKANRRPKHRTSLTDPGHTHVERVAAQSGAAGATPQGINFAVDTATIPSGSATTGITVGTNNPNDVLDAPAYEVAGVWTVKI